MKTFYSINRNIHNGKLINRVTLYKNLPQELAIRKFNEIKKRARKYSDFGGWEGALSFGFAKLVAADQYEEVEFELVPGVCHI